MRVLVSGCHVLDPCISMKNFIHELICFSHERTNILIISVRRQQEKK